jgi:polyhydroxyalkanoate synthesis regulator phasin
MPPRQSKRTTAARARRRREDDESLREQLRHFLNPLDVMVITRERLQDALDDAVARGRMTRDDSSDLLAELMRRGRRQTEEMLADIDSLLDGARGAARRGVAAPTDRVLREIDRARRAAGLETAPFPIAGYDDLTAAQVVARLDDLEPADLRQVRSYERRNANRKTVLAAVERKLDG